MSELAVLTVTAVQTLSPVVADATSLDLVLRDIGIGKLVLRTQLLLG